MNGCLNCNHPYERHLFGGMCFYCDCKRAVYETGAPFGLARREAAKGPESTLKCLSGMRDMGHGVPIRVARSTPGVNAPGKIGLVHGCRKADQCLPTYVLPLQAGGSSPPPVDCCQLPSGG